ncbi:hypothetical protein OQZ55_22170 [Bacillus subtilis]|uniref:hypothetical protein n=1 Tax=Bacillus subtilis TaxID=1423 RepID=UPI000EF26357|nr:hypothetical protein [Bacillus subtilis]AYK59058.1 hypothetical protein D9C10_18895 [Bacillus subtilis subsp. subtilis]MCT6511374.1 hypothetical protein [Bacillus subtilis]MCX4078886.1 hypothetical protein [Bacillus subtilis]MEC0395630.1 hypothetical protein [Bacillus subtilis]MEC0434784.1 hypothetical protein [Bacillus subtilis]
MSRFCLEYADSTLFHLSDFFTQFPLRITEYNWVIADFYEDDYISPVKECIFEVGFFDSTDIIFTVTDENIERMLQDAFPDLKPYCEYGV